MISKEEYVKNHMKMSLGVKIFLVVGLVSLVAAIILFVSLCPRIEELMKSFGEWIEYVCEYDENAGKYTFKFFFLGLLIVAVVSSVLYIKHKISNLGDYYTGYCEYKKRENKHTNQQVEQSSDDNGEDEVRCTTGSNG